MNQVRLFKETQDRKSMKAGQSDLSSRRVMTQNPQLREKSKFAKGKKEASTGYDKQL